MAVGLICACALVVGGVIWLRQRRQLSTPELLGSLPEGTGVLLFLNAAALRDSGVLAPSLGKTVNEEPEYRNFVSQTGFDCRTDLDQALVKFTDRGTYMVVNGRFDWTSIMDYVLHSGGSCHNGFCRVLGSEENRRISFYPVRKHVLALAVSRDGYAANSIRLGSRSPRTEPLPPEPVWLRAPLSTIRNTEKLPAGTRQFARILEPADSVLLTLGADPSGFVAGMEVDCKSEEDAAIVKTQLEDLTTMLRKMISQESGQANPADLSGILTGGTFERRSREVVGRWHVPRPFFDTLSAN